MNHNSATISKFHILGQSVILANHATDYGLKTLIFAFGVGYKITVAKIKGNLEESNVTIKKTIEEAVSCYNAINIERGIDVRI